MKLRGRAGGRALAAGAMALLLLSGCGDIRPGTAAVVNGTKISDDAVNELADAQCDLRGTLVKAGTAPASSAARVQQESLSLLMDVELSSQFGKSKSITPDKTLAAAFFGQVEPIFKPLPSKSRSEMNSVFREWSNGRAILVQAGSAATGQLPTAQNVEQLLTAGLQARDTWIKKADISTDPRYAPDKQGFPGGGKDGSVSKATSDFAKGSSATELDAKWVAALPSAQKCG